MGVPQLTPDQCREVLQADLDFPVKAEAARQLGIPLNTYKNRLNIAKRRRDSGEFDPGIQAAMQAVGTERLPELAWLKTKGFSVLVKPTKQAATDDMLERIRDAFEGMTPAEPIAAPEVVQADSLGIIPIADAHIGLVVTKDETGHEEYNRKIASDRIKSGIDRSVMALPPCHTVIIAGMGDKTHSNDPSNRTPKSQHLLRTEGTHGSNLLLAAELTAYAVDIALTRHQNVKVEEIGGNHDPQTPMPILIAMNERYRNEPRVTINLSENEWWDFTWGDAFMCAHHGHRRKAKDVCAVIPEKFRAQWGVTTEAHYFSGHFHDYKVETIGSVMHHQFPALCPVDTHAAWSPYMSMSAMVALHFDKREGLKGQNIFRFKNRATDPIMRAA